MEFDWKCDLEDLQYLLAPLKFLKKKNIDIESVELDEEEGVEEWCCELNNQWLSKDVQLVQMDINSDSYVVIPVDIKTAAYLEECSQILGQKFIKF